jgi:hypothetical protein
MIKSSVLFFSTFKISTSGISSDTWKFKHIGFPSPEIKLSDLKSKAEYYIITGKPREFLKSHKKHD